MGDSKEHDEDPSKYTKLPEPIRLEDTAENVDVEAQPPRTDDDAHEREWMLRHSAPQ